MFHESSNKVNFSDKEKAILEFWNTKEVFKKSLEIRKDSEEFVFYDGPPFATGLPHYGHLLAGTLKDIIPRYQTMKGKYVDRRFGWDCHGLPVEYEMEKQLNISGKKEIEDYGIDKFNEACRSIVLRYTAEWEKTVNRMGRWVDFRNDYKTMDLSYMETIWWVFKQLWDQGLVYEGYKVLPYCARCSTPLSNFEANQGYMEVKDPAITVKFQLKDKENEFILAWTTTPWTLPSNLALSVSEEIDYVKVKDGDAVFILAKERLSAYYRKEEEYELLETFKGKDLVGREYVPLFDYFLDQKKEGAFRVISAEFVTTEDGTGIVHIAPGFGEDDYNACLKYDISVVVPVDAEGKFTSEVKDYQGKMVKDADPEIIERLKREKKIVKREQYSHNYPHCWRCDTPLIYKTISTWFVKIEQIKDNMIANNQQIRWVPDHLKNGRFGKWLENARDWAISRNRYWGATIPIWKCSCGETLAVGSIEELFEKSGKKLDDLHKHFVDPVEIPCPKCDQKMQRIPEVFDCWFESGSMPYAQNHYPFENKKKFESHFPAEFIAEGLDQTRGWFYTLIVLSSALMKRPAFQNVIVNGLILAEDGKKMSKRLKNYPEPEKIFDQYGADALRLFLVSSPVVRAEDLKFSEEGVKDILRTILIPLWNSYTFLATYALIDGWEAQSDQFFQPKHQLDQWILSLLNKLIEDVTEAMDSYDLQKSVQPLLEFIDMLTNWYIRRSRRRFWKSDNDEDKVEAYQTLYLVLLNISKLLAPFIPFMAEEIYLNLKIDDMPESVHLNDFPLTNHSMRDIELEKKMELTQKAVSMGRAIRIKHNLKIRQPLNAIYLVTRDRDEQTILATMEDLIKDELNVKNVIFNDNESELVHFSAKANFKILGKKLGKDMKRVNQAIMKLDSDSIQKILNGETYNLILEGLELPLTEEEIVIDRQEKENLVIQNDGTLTVAIDQKLSEELISEGLIRELVHQIQNIRKEKDFDVADRIKVEYSASEKLSVAIGQYMEFLCNEVLADSFSQSAEQDLAEKYPINDEMIHLLIEKK